MRILIEVEDGIITAVHSTEECEVYIADRDNLDQYTGITRIVEFPCEKDFDEAWEQIENI